MDIITPTTPPIIRPPDPPPSRNIDLSPLEFLVALFGAIIIPTLIYTFFLFLKCPPNPFNRHRPRTSSDSLRASAAGDELADTNSSAATGTTDVATDVKYKKEVHAKDIGGECPVCLSVFADGEEVRQLTACKHSFHASCIGMWLNSHSSCPVCRASVSVIMKSDRRASVAAGEDDFRHGLPDSASLV